MIFNKLLMRQVPHIFDLGIPDGINVGRALAHVVKINEKT